MEFMKLKTSSFFFAVIRFFPVRKTKIPVFSFEFGL